MRVLYLRQLTNASEEKAAYGITGHRLLDENEE